MVNFFYQVGYTGVIIFFLGMLAVYMAIRGCVLIILIKKQTLHPNGIPQGIIRTIQDAEVRAKRQKHDELKEKVEKSVSEGQTSQAAAQVAHAAHHACLTELPSREVVINTMMQVQMKGVYSSMYFLKLCAAIGPLLGLLGTVLGMVDVFSNLSARAMPDPSLLAGGIWEALLTTVMGLNLAIPALIVHYFILMNLRNIRNYINLSLSNIHLDHL